MIKILLSDLRSVSDKRPDGYYSEVVSRGNIGTDGVLVLDPIIYRELQLKFSPIRQIPESDWPIWSKALKQFSKPDDKGIGDVIRRTIGEENSEAFKRWYKTLTGKDCGCTGRQAKWNATYPLNR